MNSARRTNAISATLLVMFSVMFFAAPLSAQTSQSQAAAQKANQSRVSQPRKPSSLHLTLAPNTRVETSVAAAANLNVMTDRGVLDHTANDGDNGSGSAASEMLTQTKALDKFTSIEISGALCPIEIVCGSSPSLTVTADRASLYNFDYNVSGGTLELSGAIHRTGTMIKITVPMLEDIEISGAQSVKILKLANKEFSADLSGACTLELTGKTKKLWLDITGACMVNARELEAEKVTVESCGASVATVFAAREICASASGVSRVMYAGKPTVVRKDVDGLAVVKAKD
jgi:hypothetical protein